MELFTNLFSSLSQKFGDQLPGVIGALVVLIIGLWLAKIIKKVVIKLMSKTSIDERLAAKMNSPMRIDEFVGKLVYYLMVLFVLLIVLNLLGVDSVLKPLEDMLGQFVNYLPKVIGAGVIGFAGYMIASIVSQATGFLAEGLESLSARMGFDTKSFDLAKLVSQLVFILVFIPILILAFDTLDMTAISDPAKEMLSSLLNSIPLILAAFILLGIFYVIGKYVTNIVSDLLRNLGADSMAENLGLGSMLGDTSISKLVGNVMFFFIMITGVIAAANKLELGQVEVILTTVMNIGGKVFFGLIILMGGIFVSNIAVKAVSGSNKSLAPIIRFAVLGIFLAFSLHTMGIAESIVNLAFGLTLGAIAVAFALSFGLGGREAAGKELQNFFDRLKK